MAARTTTTVIRTTSGSRGGGARRTGATARPRKKAARKAPRKAAAPRKARAAIPRPSKKVPTGPQRRTTTTTRSRTEITRERSSLLPLLGLLGLAGLAAVFLIPRIARAGERPIDPNNPNNPNNPNQAGGGTSPGNPPRVHPPPGTVATIAATTDVPAGTTPGLKLRPQPAPTGNTVGADLANGTSVTVVRSNIVEQGRTAANNERWWEVTTGDGRRGFIRAVGPNAEWNVQFAGRVGFAPNTGRFAAAYLPAPQPYAAVAYNPQAMQRYAQQPVTGCPPGTGCAAHPRQALVPNMYGPWARG